MVGIEHVSHEVHGLLTECKWLMPFGSRQPLARKPRSSNSCEHISVSQSKGSFSDRVLRNSFGPGYIASTFASLASS